METSWGSKNRPACRFSHGLHAAGAEGKCCSAQLPQSKRLRQDVPGSMDFPEWPRFWHSPAACSQPHCHEASCCRHQLLWHERHQCSPHCWRHPIWQKPIGTTAELLATRQASLLLTSAYLTPLKTAWHAGTLSMQSDMTAPSWQPPASHDMCMPQNMLKGSVLIHTDSANPQSQGSPV